MAGGSARVIVVNERDEVLMLLARLGDGGEGFLTPGGHVESGETPRAAAVRELREETGIEVAPEELHGPLHDAPTRWTDASGTPRTVHATIFAVAVDRPDISFGGHTPDEVGFLLGHTWVAPSAIADDPRLRNPHVPGLAVRAVAAVRSGPPQAPTPRVTARVLPVSPDGAVLLVQDLDPVVPDLLRWGTVGGAVDEGETLPAAAVREAYEETGVVVDEPALVGPFHHAVREYCWNARVGVADSTFYAVALDRDVQLSLTHLEPEEVDTVTTLGWWFPEDLEADGSAITPDLPDIMRAAVAAVAGRNR